MTTSRTSPTSLTKKALLAGALAASSVLGLSAGPARAGEAQAGAQFIDLPPRPFTDVNPCSGEDIDVVIDSQLQIVPTGKGEVLIFRSTTTSSDRGTGRGIETRRIVGDRYDFNLRIMVSTPDGDRYTIVGRLNGTLPVSFEPLLSTCLTS